MRAASAVAPLAALSALLAGCPDPEVGDPVPYPSDTAAAYCGSATALWVDRLVGCSVLAPQVAAAARDTLAASLCTAVDASAEAGRITYAPAAGGSCLTVLQRASCAEVLAVEAPLCPTAYAGTVGNGGACTLWNDCASGWCDASGTCPGVCTAWLRAGDGCWSGGECGPGLQCGQGGTCVAEPPPGSAGDDCSARVCGAGLACDPATLVCRATGAAGVACARPEGCDPGLGCASSGTCQPYRQAGSACGTPDAVCIDGTSCDAGTCRTWPGAGQPCDPAAAPCLGSWCDAGTCRAYRATGAACAADEECGPGAVCAGTCQAEVCP